MYNEVHETYLLLLTLFGIERMMARGQPSFSTAEFTAQATSKAPGSTTLLPVLISPATLRPVAFRVFTKKHSLTITASTLQLLATFVGKNCGTAWREEGLAEMVFDEIAKSWKKAGGGVIVEDGKPTSLKTILKALESNMSGGRIVPRNTIAQSPTTVSDSESRRGSQSNNDTDTHLNEQNGSDESATSNSRNWIKIINAFEQPRLAYNTNTKHFDTSSAPSSFFPPPSQRVNLVRDRYNIIYQRLLRNEAFQAPLSSSQLPPKLHRSSSFTTEQSYKLTSIANLLGRSGTSHLLLGLLSISPTGQLALTDPTGSIALDLSHAKAVPEGGAWFAPGMIVLVDGVYIEDNAVPESTLRGNDGVGGAIGGAFLGASIGGPPCERRDATLGIDNPKRGRDSTSEGGFGWVDFLGVGSEKAHGPRMRQIEKQCLRGDGQGSAQNGVVILGEIHLDISQTSNALKKVFDFYNHFGDDEIPAVFILIGNFVRHAVMAGCKDNGSVECKEYFDILASVLSNYPRILQRSTFLFVPGDNDPWASSYSAGSVPSIPKSPVPDLFTSRIKRTFKAANNDRKTANAQSLEGNAVWTTNPARISVFGPVQELVVFRDDISGRLRRTSLMFKETEPQEVIQEAPDHDTDSYPTSKDQEESTEKNSDETQAADWTYKMSRASIASAQKLVKTILDQSYLSPFPLNVRPVLWDYASSLHLYPLPTTLILADMEAEPFTITYEGCHVMNPGRLIPEGSKGLARWIEYDMSKRKGMIREARF